MTSRTPFNFIKTLLFGIMILSGFAVTGAFSASAEEYKSMIRYDRVWECYSDGYGSGLTVKCMRFVGAEEINGKEYHKIETFRKIFPEIDYSNNTWIHDNYVDGLHEHEGYLREENGMVYTLIVCAKDNLPVYDGRFDTAYGPLFIPGKYEPNDNEVLFEMPVYDFTIKRGELYNGMSFCKGDSHLCAFTVIRDENIDIKGEDYRKICLVSGDLTENLDYKDYNGEEIIEGIGATEYGCLNYHELNDRPAMIWAHNYFTRLLDLDGNVLYNPRPYAMFDISYESFQTPDNVEAITTSVELATPLYDILGRRIVSPAPGQLYIQGGKKHIAK
ncbi:MAG: hypothetical protein K2N09_08935 [Muribaculaceae bacterium]|nr:hypothetical protein [Muribaculaceae bacterium]